MHFLFKGIDRLIPKIVTTARRSCALRETQGTHQWLEHSHTYHTDPHTCESEESTVKKRREVIIAHRCEFFAFVLSPLLPSIYLHYLLILFSLSPFPLWICFGTPITQTNTRVKVRCGKEKLSLGTGVNRFFFILSSLYYLSCIFLILFSSLNIFGYLSHIHLSHRSTHAWKKKRDHHCTPLLYLYFYLSSPLNLFWTIYYAIHTCEKKLAFSQVWKCWIFCLFFIILLENIVKKVIINFT